MIACIPSINFEIFSVISIILANPLKILWSIRVVTLKKDIWLIYTLELGKICGQVYKKQIRRDGYCSSSKKDVSVIGVSGKYLFQFNNLIQASLMNSFFDYDHKSKSLRPPFWQFFTLIFLRLTLRIFIYLDHNKEAELAFFVNIVKKLVLKNSFVH